MTKPIGVDADQVHGKDNAKPKAAKALGKTPYLAAKMTVSLPKTLMQDLRGECERRKLSHHGVLRDLAIAWIAANKDGVNFEEYKALIQGEVDSMNAWAKDVKERNLLKLSSAQRHINYAKRKEEEKRNAPSEKDLAPHRKNPHDGWLLD